MSAFNGSESFDIAAVGSLIEQSQFTERQVRFERQCGDWAVQNAYVSTLWKKGYSLSQNLLP